MRNTTKIILFALLIGIFYAYAIMGDHGQDYVTANQRISGAYGMPFFTQRTKTMILFTMGAWMAIWGDKKLGTIEPISIRIYLIIVGLIMMAVAFLMMNTLNFY